MSDLHRHSINPVGADKADIESIGSDVKAPENVGTTVEAIDADDIARLAEHDHVRKNFKCVWHVVSYGVQNADLTSLGGGNLSAAAFA
jgi:L-fucose isomerase-like protein